MKLTFQSEVRTQRSKRPVRLSGVFVDAAGSIKGLTVLRVLGDTPTDERIWTLVSDPQDVFRGEQTKVGVLDPFWWELRGEDPTFMPGGAKTCLFTLTEGIKPDDKRWLKDYARKAIPEACVGKPARLAEGEEIGDIVDELNYLPFGGHSLYPLLKLRRSQFDREANVGIRNGAMVFTQEGAMIGVIVATFGGGQFYSIAPIDDIFKLHGITFIAEPTQNEARATEDQVRMERTDRPKYGSKKVLELLGD